MYSFPIKEKYNIVKTICPECKNIQIIGETISEYNPKTNIITVYNYAKRICENCGNILVIEYE